MNCNKCDNEGLKPLNTFYYTDNSIKEVFICGVCGNIQNKHTFWSNRD